MINRRLAVLAALLAPLAACVSGSDSTTPSPNPNSGFQVRFTPLGGLMPFPNDLFFNGSTTGTLNIPGDPAVTQNAPLLALNHLDGFGTQSDISIYFTAPVDKNSLAANVHVYKVASSPFTKAVNPAVAPTPLAAGTDYSIGLSPGIDSGNEIVTIKPLKPLAASSVNGATPTPATYLVVVTTGVKDTSGNPVSPSADYQAILSAFLPVLSGKAPGTTGNPALDKVGLFTAAQLAVAAGAGLDPTKIAVTFSFSTQYLGLSLAELAAHAAATAQPPGVGIIDTGLTVCAALVAAKKLPSSAACATAAPGSTITEVFAGDVALPYYLPVPTKNDPTAALTGFWHNANGGDTALSASATSVLPKATVAQNVIPILVALPKAGGPCTMPVSGWPVVIFQHGITRNREDMLAIASTLAVGAAPTLCNAVLAIDLPLHGVTDTTDALYLKGHERTFDMDLEDNNTLAAGPDNKIDASGAWFINLQSTITSRDNLREGAADLLNLVATLPALDAITLPATINLFDSSQVSFVGHSLGGIVGTEFLGADTAGAGLTSTAPKIATATLAMPGGHIAELLRNSPAFGPIIDAGLAANGLVKGTQSYYDFYSEAQAAVEDGDPANYAVLAAAGHPIHMLEVVGGFAGAGDSCDLPDLVVPNANTDLLASLMGLAQVNTTTPGSKFIVRFLVGDHGSILDPSVPGAPTTCANDPTNQLRYGAATVEMQTEAVKWVVAAGTAVSIDNVPPIIK